MSQELSPNEIKSVEALVGRYESYRLRQKRLELLLVGAAGFGMSVVFLAVLSLNSALFYEAVEVIRSFEGTDTSDLQTPEGICSTAKNQESLFCKQRLERANTQWYGYNRFNAPTKNAFPLEVEFERNR